MKRYTKLGLAWLLMAIALLVASCGGAGGMGNADEGQMEKKERPAKEGMEGMGHSKMDGGSGGMASGMMMKNGEYSDERFIDAMVPHHQGAVEMAQVALKNAEHEEVKQLSEDIVTAQEAEIEELKAIKRQKFGTSRVPMQMGAGEMEAMGMTDPGELANKDPFDKAFIDAMIPHHRSAIEMAHVALKESDNPEIREIARNIVGAQKKEIAQMQEWRRKWYPEG